MISACKKAQDSDAMILRMVETAGNRPQVRVDFGRTVCLMEEVNMMEEKINERRPTPDP